MKTLSKARKLNNKPGLFNKKKQPLKGLIYLKYINPKM